MIELENRVVVKQAMFTAGVRCDPSYNLYSMEVQTTGDLAVQCVDCCAHSFNHPLNKICSTYFHMLQLNVETENSI